jgi:hypothetical protein
VSAAPSAAFSASGDAMSGFGAPGRTAMPTPTLPSVARSLRTVPAAAIASNTATGATSRSKPAAVAASREPARSRSTGPVAKVSCTVSPLARS